MDGRPAVHPSQFVVVFSKDVERAADVDEEIRKIVGDLGGTIVHQNTHVRTLVLIDASKESEREALMDAYEADPRVEAVTWNTFAYVDGAGRPTGAQTETPAAPPEPPRRHPASSP